MTPEQFTQLRRLISTRLSDHLGGIFRAPGSWRDPDAARFVAQAVPLVQGTQQTLASLVALYVAERASTATGRSVAAPLIASTAIYDLRGVDPAVVYRRPFIATWTSLAKGDDLPTAVDRGANRLAQIAEGDMQQTHSSVARAAMRTLPDVPSGWRRVLKGPSSCAECIAAAGHVFGLDELNPTHHQCNCRIEAVYGPRPVALGPLRAEIAHHGELGPLLVRPQDHHISPADPPA